MKKFPILISLCAFASITLAACCNNNTPEVTYFTVCFKNYDETLLSETTVEKGHNAVYTGRTPTRPETSEYTYTFSGWDKSLENITSSTTFVAQYTVTSKPVTNYYTVTFKNYDGSILHETTVKEGETAIYGGVTPTRAETTEYTYTFSGWDKSLENITSDSVRVAQYTETPKTVTQYYTVSFKNYDGTLLYEDTVEKGGTAVYGGTTPIRAETAEYTYTFSGWDQPLTNITGDTVRVAQYAETKKPVTNYYTVTFKNYDGSILHETSVEEGKNATYGGAVPTRPETPEFTFTFEGWDKSLENIRANTTVIAQYSQTYKEYTVKFYSYNNQLLYTDVVHYQQSASYYGPIPTKPSTSTHHYTFKCWDKDLTSITKSISVNPIFDEFGNESLISLNPNNGQDSGEIEVAYGENYDLGIPTFSGFNFLGWYKDETTLIPTSGTWIYSGVTSVTAKWESVYFDFTPNGDNTYSVALTTAGKNATEIAIPSFYEGLAVTSLGAEFLKQNTVIKKITIPGTIKDIPEYSFYYCEKLAEVKFNEGLLTIGQHAFEYCKLSKLIIPSTCTTIGRSAFDYNRSLYHIYIPSSVASMGAYAFDVLNASAYICIEHESIPSAWNSNWSSYTTYTNSIKLVEDEEYNYVVRSIYGNLSVTILRISEAVSKLQNYTFPNEIENITDIRVGQSLFKDNKYIRNINFGAITRIGSYAFNNCTNLETVTFSNSLTVIGSHSFRFCESLLRVEIPDSVTEIQGYAFDTCANLTYIYIPSTVVTIGTYAFDACGKSTIYTNAHTANSGWSSNWKGSQPIYYDFVSLHEADDFNYVVQTYMGDSYITITSMKDSAKLKKNIVIPNQIGDINDIRLATELFSGFSELVSIDLGSGVSKIPSSCFINCSKLETVILHETVTSIGSKAFYNCSKLSSINMPSTLTTIGNSAFDYCTSLREVKIPLSVSSIGSYAFDVTGKTALLIEASVAQPGWNSNWAGSSTGNKQFVYDYVSSGTIGDFRYAKASNGVTDTIYILGLVEGSTNVNLVVPNQIENITNIKIANLAFDGNTIIKSLDLGSSVTYIGSYAFRGNISLASVIIPASCIVIKNYAFYNCSTQCVLNCEVESKPDTWESNWNSSSCQVVWGYTR